MPVPAKKRDDASRRAARGAERGPRASPTLGLMLQGGQEAPAKWVVEPEPAPLPGAPPYPTPTPSWPPAFACRRGTLPDRPCPGRGRRYETPGVLTPRSTRAHQGWPVQALAPGMAPRGPGTAAAPGATRSLHSLGWGPAGSGAGRAWRKRSRTRCARPGMLRELRTCRARRLSLLPYLAMEAVLDCSSGLSPRAANGSGCLRTYPRLPQPRGSHRSEGWARVSSPSPGG